MGNQTGRRSAIWGLSIALLCVAAPAQGFTPRVQAVVPTTGTYIGTAIDWGQWNWSMAAVSSTLAFDPASHVLFTKIPADDGDKWALDTILSQIAARQIAVIVTPEPMGGLAAVTDAAITDYVDILAKWEQQGATVIVRFGHEMNGSWYPWGQRPTEFIAAFRRFAAILRARTQRATMLWGPNLGTGYPYLGGQYIFDCTARPADCATLDTNHDGQVTETDDMFSPYWPGDDAVDWVGTSLYWWGNQYPWGENEIPTPTFFADVLQGNIVQGGVPLPNFYATYSANKNKAMAVTETAALYSLCDLHPESPACKSQVSPPGPTQLAVKSAWWQQVFSLQGAQSLRLAFPNIKIVSWFNIRKVESEAQGNTVDWTMYADASVKSAFLSYIKSAKGELRTFWLYAVDFKNVAWPATAGSQPGKKG